MTAPALADEAGGASAAAAPSKDECISANESAQDLQAKGKLRAAKEKLAVCVSATCPAVVRQDCTQRQADIEKAIPTVVLVAKDAAGKDLGAVRVTMDGHVIAESLGGTALAMDPGEHHFAFEAAGFPLLEKTLVLAPGDKDRREFVVFNGVQPAGAAAPTQPAAAAGPAAAAPVTAAPSPSSPAPAAAAGPSAPEAPHNGKTQRLVGLALGGAGAVGIVVGGIFGVLTKTSYDHAITSECGPNAGFANPKACSPAGVQDVQSAHDDGTIATVGFVAGLALLGGGAYLYFTAPKASAVGVSPVIGPGVAGLTVRGGW
ncbi:MAG: hypothetical protein ACRENE_20810 [Polyangiaceae bacterium]